MEEALNFIVEAAKGGQWNIVAAGVVTLLVRLFRGQVSLLCGLRFLRRIPEANRLPLVSAVLATLAAVGSAFATSHPVTAMDWLNQIQHGVVQGAAASGLWSLALKSWWPTKEPITLTSVSEG